MARTELTAVAAPGSYADDGTAIAFVASDNVNGNYVTLTGTELVIARNDNVAAQTVTVSSVDDPYNRTGDITTDSLDAGIYHIYGPFKVLGWRQADGTLYLDSSSADIMFAVIRL